MTKLLPNWSTGQIEDLRVFARIRLIAVDLDGTLLPSELHEKVQNLIRSLSRGPANVRVAIATGRALNSVRPILEKVSAFRDVPIALYNGSLIVRASAAGDGLFDELRQLTIPNEVMGKVLYKAENLGVSTLAYFFRDSFSCRLEASSVQEVVMGWTVRPQPGHEFNGLPVLWRPYEVPDNDLSPVAMLLDTESDPRLAETILQSLATIPHISFTQSGSHHIEIGAQGSGKDSAVEFIAAQTHRARGQVLAIGDNDNDAAMLAWAGVGVAIGTASQAALDASDYQCRHGSFEGVVEVLRLVKHARRLFPSQAGRLI